MSSIAATSANRWLKAAHRHISAWSLLYAPILRRMMLWWTWNLESCRYRQKIWLILRFYLNSSLLLRTHHQAVFAFREPAYSTDTNVRKCFFRTQSRTRNLLCSSWVTGRSISRITISMYSCSACFWIFENLINKSICPFPVSFKFSIVWWGSWKKFAGQMWAAGQSLPRKRATYFDLHADASFFDWGE